MRRMMIIFIIMLGILIPEQSFAMLDFLDSVVKVGEQAEGSITKIESIYESVEKKLQEFSSKFDNVKKLREKAKKVQQQVKKVNETRKQIENGDYVSLYNTHLSNVQIPGTNKAANSGDNATPELEQQVAMSYFSRTNQANDVQVAKAKKTNLNRKIVKNFSANYANALTQRRSLQKQSQEVAKELESKDGESKDVPELLEKYGAVLDRADNHWIDILRFEATSVSTVLEVTEMNKRIDDISEIIGVDEATAAKAMSKNGGDLTLQQPQGGVTVGEVVNSVSDKVNTATDIYNKVSSGDYRGAYDATSTASDTVNDYYKQWKAKKAAEEAANGADGGSGAGTGGGTNE